MFLIKIMVLISVLTVCKKYDILVLREFDLSGGKNMFVSIPYGKEHIEYNFDESFIRGVLVSRLHEMKSECDQTESVVMAMDDPIGAKRLCEAVKGKKKIAIITSDHTRPVPSKISMPIILDHVRRGAPNAEITIIIATGVHRSTTKEELIYKFGEKIASTENIVIHDAFKTEDMVYMGVLPSGCKLSVNKVVAEADMVIAEGFIEPHFFAGFSGGRKSILPGVASAESVMSNHCGRLVGSQYSRTGNLAGNPLHEDMVAAAKMCKLEYIVNVVIDAEKKIVKTFAGDTVLAHERGCEFVKKQCRVDAKYSDIVLTSNGGYPLDQNVYQSIKSMTAAEACVNDGGVIICVSKCNDGSGGDELVRWFSDGKSAQEISDIIINTPPEQTKGDQWMAQILSRIMLKATVIMVSDECSRDIIETMGMIWCSDIDSAITKAREICPYADGISIIPDGISVIVENK